MRERVAAHNDTPKPGEWWAFDLSPDHSGDWQPQQIPEDGGFPKCNRRRVYPDAFWVEVTDRMQAEIDGLRTAFDESSRRIEATLAFVEKWDEGQRGWAAILRGEDG